MTDDRRRSLERFVEGIAFLVGMTFVFLLLLGAYALADLVF